FRVSPIPGSDEYQPLYRRCPMSVYRPRSDSPRLRAFLNNDRELWFESLRRLDYAGFKRAQDAGNQAYRLKLWVVWRRDKGRCYLCKQKLKFWEFSIDHVVPIAKGGGHTYDNVKICCLKCNQRKSDKLEGDDNAEETTTARSLASNQAGSAKARQVQMRSLRNISR